MNTRVVNTFVESIGVLLRSLGIALLVAALIALTLYENHLFGLLMVLAGTFAWALGGSFLTWEWKREVLREAEAPFTALGPALARVRLDGWVLALLSALLLAKILASEPLLDMQLVRGLIATYLIYEALSRAWKRYKIRKNKLKN